jgi:hypothetical protein
VRTLTAAARTLRLQLGPDHSVRICVVSDATFRSFNARATPTYDRMFQHADAIHQLQSAVLTQDHGIHVCAPFRAYASSHGRTVGKLTPQHAAVKHRRLMAVDAPTAIRRLRLDQALSLLRAPTITYCTYTLFPQTARLALETAEVAINDPAVTLRVHTTTLTLADGSGRRVHRFANFALFVCFCVGLFRSFVPAIATRYPADRVV